MLVSSFYRTTILFRSLIECFFTKKGKTKGGVKIFTPPWQVKGVLKF